MKIIFQEKIGGGWSAMWFCRQQFLRILFQFFSKIEDRDVYKWRQTDLQH